MSESEWDDPPGVNLDGSVADDTDQPDRVDREREAAPPRRGPFSGLRSVLGLLFWGGFVLATVAGALGVGGSLPPLAGAIKLTLAYAVTIAWWLAAGWWVLWAIDKILVFLKS